MAATVPDLGSGGTITFGTSNLTLQWRSIDIGEVTRAVVDTTHLGTTQTSTNQAGSRTFIPGDHQEISEISVEFHWDPSALALVDAAAETVTITYPDTSTLAGSGFCFSVKPPTLEPDALQVGTLKIKPSGVWTYAEV